MTFAGLPLATLMTVAGIAGGLTVVLYILKLRRRPIAVPFSRIWERILRDKEATSLFSQLKRLLSLLLQLAMLAALIFALGDPRIAGNFIEGRNVVVLVDASASMKATDAEPTRIEAAKKKVREMISGLGGSDRMLIAQMDASLTPLSTMTGEVPDLELAADQLRATDTRADFARGLSFAIDSLRDLPKPEIVVISDGALGDVGPVGEALGDTKLSFVPVGKSKKNVAITGFSVRRYPLDKSRYEVMLEVTNTNDEPVDVELSLLGDGAVVDVTRIKLGANERLPRFYKDLAGASRTLEAVIKLGDGTADTLPADDHAYALMPERRRARVLVVTKANTYLEAALLLDEYLDVTMVKPSDYPPAGAYDVTIFDGVAPPPAPNGGGLFYLNPPEEGAPPVKLGKKIDGFGFDIWDRKHPILRWMALENIQIANGHALKGEKGDKVIGASALGPILMAGRRSGRKFVAAGFDPRDSDFVLRVAWPLFVLNTINFFVEEDTHYISSYRTGDVWRIPAPSSLETAQLVDPSGKEHKVPVKEGRAIFLGEQAGFYKLLVNGNGSAAADTDDAAKESDAADDGETMFAANLSDPRESLIEPVETLEIGGKTAGEVSGFTAGVRREIWLYLLLAVLLVSLIEWFTYHRRLTV